VNTQEFERITVAGEPDPVFPDGIYFGMSNEDYHADPALGSSNMRDLLTGGPTYWWNSHLNPQRKRKTTRALDFGSAVHAMVLEGEPAFLAQFAEEPDPEGALDTYADVKKWLLAQGEAKVPRAKADAVAQARLVDPTVRILDLERQAIVDAKRTILSDDDWARVQVASAVIRQNPELRTAFRGGIPEVSVFWTVDGVRVKCRFDFLKPKANVDLKSLGNTQGEPFPAACRKVIARRRMDLQAAHYMRGREQFSLHHAEGRVFGLHDAALVKRIAEAETWGWAWVFIQSVEAPLTWATTLQRENPILEVGAMAVDRSLEVYREYMARFGRETMWILAEPVAELDQSELPGWWAQQ
jgi:hypothetical protein